ncbi:toll/interleukin-1 receptor domain-containing protein [Rhizobium sp. WYCCWR 11290]|uniref:Toll/interleukin-1 receptor domain-containing protein n=1 Tax=Rhizobium changzhiense TaxID=2692317 RepID=A0A7Z0RLA3_9HYPH|nr:toll/interleukin-1 receptor domain-containing protein [Rhizobium changzhiense]NZD63634.1 toll/interleukin-1 receptor domain-containing protein [Rhizobium changzhiense]
MTEDAHLRELVDFVTEVVSEAVEALRSFPEGYLPQESQLPRDTEALPLGQFDFSDILAEAMVQAFLAEQIRALPERVQTSFLNAGSVIGQILANFGVSQDKSPLPDVSLLLDEDFRNLMLAAGQYAKEVRESDDLDDADPVGFGKAAMSELLRRNIAARAPYARMLTTLLGEDALIWLTAASERGSTNLQPHEFSRDGWHRLSEIETQVSIEHELTMMDPSLEIVSKCVVTASWTLVALASYMDPACFLGEHTTRILSQRDGQFTFGGGVGSRVLQSFEPGRMVPLLGILADGLSDPLLSAADLMWIAAGLARVRHVKVRHQEATPLTSDRFGVFLSHRGCDAKFELASTFEGLPAGHGVFLDCMTLPRGVINRSFVYKSLTNADSVVIVETEHFRESQWCLKEAWLSDAMAGRGLLRVERLSLPDAMALVRSHGPATRRQSGDPRHVYGITARVLRDIGYWARRPNLHSLQEAGVSAEPLSSLRALLDIEPAPDDPAWREALTTAVLETLERVVAAAPDGEPVDLWATALQFALAAFGHESQARSKDEVRRGVDQLNLVLKRLLERGIHRDREFRSRAPAYLAFLAGAVAIQLSGFALDERLVPAVKAATCGAAVLHGQLLLLDAREPGAPRDLRLRLAAALIASNVGSVGIIQNAWDEVHKGEVDGIPLEVLPCVTMHPGMEGLQTIGNATT